MGKKKQQAYSPKRLGTLFAEVLEMRWGEVNDLACDFGPESMVGEAEDMSESQRRKVGEALIKCKKAANEFFASWGTVYSIFEEGVLPADDDGEDEEDPDEE